MVILFFAKFIPLLTEDYEDKVLKSLKAWQASSSNSQRGISLTVDIPFGFGGRSGYGCSENLGKFMATASKAKE